MSELSLTGKSISPIQQGSRSLSARSRTSAGDSRRIRSAANVSSLNSQNGDRRSKSGLAPSFVKTGEYRSSPRRANTRSSTDYLALFESPSRRQNNTAAGSNRSSYSDIDSVRQGFRSMHVPVVRSEQYSVASKSKTKKENTVLPNSYSTKNKDLSTKSKHQILEDPTNARKSTATQYSDENQKKIKQPDHNHSYSTKGSVLEEREKSAVKIQKWFRRHSQRKKSSQAALKRLMQQKKTDIESSMNEDKQRTRQRSEDERRRKRKEREREERRKAIAELSKSRELQEREYKSIVEKEVGKVTEKRSRKNIPAKPKQSKKPDNSLHVSEVEAVREVEEKIDSLFQQTKTDTEKTHTKSVSSTESIPEDIQYESTAISTSQSQGLLESLLETIQQLEAEPEQLAKPAGSKFDEKLSWIDEMQSDHQSVVSNTKSALSGAGDNAAPSDSDVILTKAKLSNLMDFLDKAEKRDQEYEAAKSEVSNTYGGANPTNSVTESDKIAEMVEAEKVASNVTSELLQLRLEVDEKTKSVDMLKKALQQHRELSLRQVQDQDKELNQRLRMQKEQYEATIKRHLSFIDQLIDDKKTLNEKCERVVMEMKDSETKYKKKIRELQETHAVESKKQKEIYAAAEKLRREKWIDEKTRTIKEMTVKGLEPEIQKLIARHKQEVKKVKAIHEAELLQSDERAGQRYIRQTEELREHLETEKEAACNREREMARQRYEKQLEQEEMALQQQRRRLYAEVADEKERINEQAARQRADVDKLKEQLQNQNSLATSALTDEYKKSALEAERRHQMEVETLKERLELEKQAWQETYMKKQEAYILQKERELKDAVRRDRDTEIESVIEQLEKDTRVQREQVEKTSENRIKRIREKYESELKEIEILERQTQEKYNNLKVQYSDVEAENMMLKSAVAQKDQEIVDVKKIKEKLVLERGNVSDIIREEFAERLVHIEEENKRMKNEIAQMRARQRLELDRVNKEKEEELSEVHKRVRAAIVKKEEAIGSVKEQYEAAVKRADHLEGLLETQRKQLLSVKK